MIILLPGMRADLSRWEGRGLAPGACDATCDRDSYRRVVGRGPEVFARAAAAVMRYDIFPSDVGTRVMRREPLQLGDTVGLRYGGFPLIGVFFASRVIDVFATDTRVGFTYRTLTGHPEFGEETFEATYDPVSGDVAVALTSWSRPGIWLTRLLRPVARRTQVRASERALDHLEGLSRISLFSPG